MAGMCFAARFVPFIFGLIGVLVIVSVWLVNGFGEPPLFFKLFATLIASVFCAMGFGGAFYGPKLNGGFGRGLGRRLGRRRAGEQGYTCPHCQGGLESKTEVSPSGDVKCAFCERWFNIHQ